jgi:hypothetical protein
MKILVLLLAFASIMLLFPLIYALVYAKPDSSFWQHRLVIGICFMVITRFALLAYRRFRRGHSEA